MIQFYSDDKVMVGVTRLNITKLTNGLPLHVKLVRPVSTLIVVFGEDKRAIVAQIEAAGIEVPQAVKDSSERDAESNA